ncbi:toxin HicA [Thermodesulfobacteriota bacterium]
MIAELKESPANVTFSCLCNICDFFFGESRQSGTSHRVYKTPWKGDPRINIQKKGNKAKAYQVRQVMKALENFRVGGCHG